MKTTKRLFSWLIVLAMVLSMVPVIGLPAAATEVEEGTPAAVRFPSDVESYEAECPVCKTTVTWKPYNGENNSEDSGVVLTDSNSNAHFHLYLTEDKTVEAGKYFLVSYRKVCFNLNGYNVTASESGNKAVFMDTTTLNMIDTFGGSVVTGCANNNGTGAVIHVNGGNGAAVVNLYGGTYKKLASDTKSSIVRVSTNGGTVNMYEGAVIDASDATIDTNAVSPAVSLAGCVKTNTNEETGETTTTKQYATFNMYGGEIKGGTAISGGAVMIGVYSTTNLDCAVFNLYDGKIAGGTTVDVLNADGSQKQAACGGNFSIQYGGTLNVYGGVIADGYVSSAVSGTNWGGNIRAWNGNVNIAGGLIYGGHGGKQLQGANVSVYSDAAGNAAGRGFLTISGGTIVGDVATTAKNSTTLTISGSPKIVTSLEIEGKTVNAVSGGLLLNNGANIDVSKLNSDAIIAVSGPAVGNSFTAAYEKAADVAACFISADGKLAGKAHTDNTIFLADAPVPGAANLTKEVYAKINAAKAIDNSDKAIDAHVAAKTCPMCGAKDVTWTKGTIYVPNLNKVTGQTRHYYFDSVQSGTSNFVQMVKLDGVDSANNTICVALKSTANITLTKYRVQMGGTNNTLNIMGTGTLKADQNAEGASDLGLFQMDGGTLNLYGGTFLHKNYMRQDSSSKEYRYAVIRMDGTCTVNIYKDAKIGPAELVTTEASTNVYMRSKNAVLNIYGGTIRNGVAFRSSSSGNINNTAGGTVNMYGGTIIGGAPMVDAEGKLIQIDGAEINDTKANVRCIGGSFNMYGGTITGGYSKNGGNGAGVFVSNGGALNIIGGTITGGQSSSYGGNVGGWTGTINISGTALIENGSAPNGGANLYIPNASLKVNISGGTLRGGEAKLGGNIYLVKNTSGGYLNITGGVIEGGKATNAAEGGGNLYIAAGTSVTLAGGIIRNGEAAGAGGNIYTHQDLTIGKDVQILDGVADKEGGNIKAVSACTITNEGTIMGGKAKQFGGNISQGTGNTFIMNGGVLANGTLTNATSGSHWGGNIRSWNGKVTINGGLIYGGSGAVANVHANNIGALGDQTGANRPVLTINGGTIVGDVATSPITTEVNEETGVAEVTFPGTEVILTGAPTIVSSLEIDGQTVKATNSALYIANGVVADISGLTAEAKIEIASPYTNVPVTAPFEGAAALADVFTVYNNPERYYLVLSEDNAFHYVSSAMAIMSAENEAVWYKTAEEAIAAYYAEGGFEKQLYLRVGHADQAITLAGDAYLNLAGYDLVVSGEGTVYGFDTANDDYDGYGLLTVAENAEIEVAAETKLLKNRYVNVPEDGKYGFHRLAMWLSDVTLRTSNPGMYYKAAYQCDAVLAELVDSYGVALSLNAVPTLEFATEAGVKYTQYDGEAFAANRNGSLVNSNSGSVVGILKEKNSAETNTANMNRVIYANAYISFAKDGWAHTVISDSINAGKTVADEDFKGTAYSLVDILEAVNENWENYSDEDKLTVAEFLVKWSEKITPAAMQELIVKLDNIVSDL